jgi:hypothetical protein
MTPRRLLLAGVLVAAAVTPGASADTRDLTGACYCRAASELRCVGDLVERECRRRCTEELCDDWFWLERRPCWNWGYGG